MSSEFPDTRHYARLSIILLLRSS